MTNKSCTTQQPTKHRSRPRRQLSFAEWMAKTDTEVEAMARKVSSKIPLASLLKPAQLRILEIAAECMRNLPPARTEQDLLELPHYVPLRTMFTSIFRMKCPAWQARKDNCFYYSDLPADQYKLFMRLLNNCAGRSEPEMQSADQDDDD